MNSNENRNLYNQLNSLLLNWSHMRPKTEFYSLFYKILLEFEIKKDNLQCSSKIIIFLLKTLYFYQLYKSRQSSVTTLDINQNEELACITNMLQNKLEKSKFLKEILLNFESEEFTDVEMFFKAEIPFVFQSGVFDNNNNDLEFVGEEEASFNYDIETKLQSYMKTLFCRLVTIYLIETKDWSILTNTKIFSLSFFWKYLMEESTTESRNLSSFIRNKVIQIISQNKTTIEKDHFHLVNHFPDQFLESSCTIQNLQNISYLPECYETITIYQDDPKKETSYNMIRGILLKETKVVENISFFKMNNPTTKQISIINNSNLWDYDENEQKWSSVKDNMTTKLISI